MPTPIAILTPVARLLPLTCLAFEYGTSLDAPVFLINYNKTVSVDLTDVAFQLCLITQFNFNSRICARSEFSNIRFYFFCDFAVFSAVVSANAVAPSDRLMTKTARIKVRYFLNINCFSFLAFSF
jgi:hypothetical protein